MSAVLRRGNGGDAAGKQPPHTLADMDIVVIGGGMAGTRLAQQLMPYDAVRVTVIGEEPHAPYNRVLLAEVLAGRYGPETIALPGPLPSPRPRRAVRVDRADRTVLCDDGSAVRYDRLVLATGSNAVLPPLRGLFAVHSHELPGGVHAFRTMDDCLALAAAAGPGTRVVVVGGGLLGVSAAQALTARGAQVVVAQQGEHLMERHLDAQAAALLRDHLEAQGVEVHTECRVRGLRTRPSAHPGGRAVTAVELADGYLLTADLVVLACGIRPRTGLATAAGLRVDRGILVADDLRTDDRRIFAIGDCAQHDGVVYGLAGAARDQADVLAGVLAAEATQAAGTQGTREPEGTRRVPGPDDTEGAQPTQGAAHAAAPAAGGDTATRAGAAASDTGNAGDAVAAGAPVPVTGSGAAEVPPRPVPRYRGTRALTRLTLEARRTPAASATAAAPGPKAGPPAGTGSPPGPNPRSAALTGQQAPAGPASAPVSTPASAAPPSPAAVSSADPGPASAGPAAAGRPGDAAEPRGPSRRFELAAFGDPVAAAGDDVLRLADATRGAYRKVVVRGDRLVGGILLGDLAAVGTVARTWEGDEPLPAAPLLHLLTDDGGH